MKKPAKSTLLSEVIADAKAVKHTAEQAAFSALKEAFQPTINRLVSNKLAEEGELDDEPETDDIDLDSTESPEPPAAEPTPEEEDYMEDEPDEDDVDLEEILRELDGEDDEEMMDEEDDMEGNEDLFNESDDADEDDLDDSIDEIINEVEDELEEEDDMEDEPAPSPEVTAESKRLRRQLKKTRLDLKEAHLAIATLKSALTEVNILNTKLTYATKLLKNNNLSEAKQTEILKSFDRAKTIREVKLVYATIVESLKKVKTPTIKESFNKTPKAVNPNGSDFYSFAPRWKDLAGIK